MKFFTSDMSPKLVLLLVLALFFNPRKKSVQGQFLQPIRPDPHTLLSWFLVVALFFTVNQVTAQSLRDPTSPPREATLADVGSAETSLGIENGAMTIIVRSGQPNLMIGTLLYAQGAKIGQVRIERITETEVWLREGGVLRKVTQFPGIHRRAVTPVSVAPACASNSSNLSSPAARCVRAQP
jgi:hypothetical protein